MGVRRRGARERCPPGRPGAGCWITCRPAAGGRDQGRDPARRPYDAVMPQPGGPGPGQSRSLVPLLIDEGTDFGARAARHLREEPGGLNDLGVGLRGARAEPGLVLLGWRGHGSDVQPPGRRSGPSPRGQPEGVAELRRGRHRRRHRRLPAVAALRPDLPPADQDPAYLAKYAEHIPRIGSTPERFARRYNSQSP